MALRLGITQQTCSSLERHAESVGLARLLKLLGILGVELVLSKPGGTPYSAAVSTPPDQGDKPAW